MTVTVEAIKATAQCPSGSGKMGQNLSITGVHSVTLKNDGASDQTCRIKVSIETDGDQNSIDEPVVIRAKSSNTWSYRTPLLVSYDTPGDKRVTANTTVSGAATKDASNSCTVTITA